MTPTPPAAPPSPTTSGASPAVPLISLERPFDVDEFSGLLGETSIRVTVPLEHLAEVLRRVTDFMGFGIYVYSFTIRPASSELLKSFVVRTPAGRLLGERQDVGTVRGEGDLGLAVRS